MELNFLNPAIDDVQNFVLQLLGDLAKYDLDGIIPRPPLPLGRLWLGK
ncbi:hypothetical protein NXW13_23450 [Bacteroides thetaiotaomicron]|nr:hypothetical protein [Bacteroides thetaiotaomicron]